jgi:hypothetical protein
MVADGVFPCAEQIAIPLASPGASGVTARRNDWWLCEIEQTAPSAFRYATSLEREGRRVPPIGKSAVSHWRCGTTLLSPRAGEIGALPYRQRDQCVLSGKRNSIPSDLPCALSFRIVPTMMYAAYRMCSPPKTIPD